MSAANPALPLHMLRYVQHHSGKSRDDIPELDTFFTHGRSVVHTIPDVVVRCLATTSQGEIWIGERSGAVSRWGAYDAELRERVERTVKGLLPCAMLSVGLHVWVGFNDGTLRLYDPVAISRVLFECKEHAGAITALEVAHNQCFVFSASLDFSIVQWEANTGIKVQSLSGHRNAVRCLRVVGIRLFSGGDDNRIIEWDVVNGRPLHVLSGHHGGVRCLEASTLFLWSGSDDATIRIWNLQPPNPAVAGSAPNLLVVPDIPGVPLDVHRATLPPACVHMITNPFTTSVTQLRVVGSKVWSVSLGTVYVWNNATFALEAQFKEHDGLILAVQPVRQSVLSRVWTCGAEGTVLLWNAESNYVSALDASAELHTMHLEHSLEQHFLREEKLAEETRRHRQDNEALRRQVTDLTTELQEHRRTAAAQAASDAATIAGLRQELDASTSRCHQLERDITALHARIGVPESGRERRLKLLCEQATRGTVLVPDTSMALPRVQVSLDAIKLLRQEADALYGERLREANATSSGPEAVALSPQLGSDFSIADASAVRTCLSSLMDAARELGVTASSLGASVERGSSVLSAEAGFGSAPSRSDGNVTLADFVEAPSVCSSLIALGGDVEALGYLRLSELTLAEQKSVREMASRQRQPMPPPSQLVSLGSSSSAPVPRSTRRGSTTSTVSYRDDDDESGAHESGVGEVFDAAETAATSPAAAQPPSMPAESLLPHQDADAKEVQASALDECRSENQEQARDEGAPLLSLPPWECLDRDECKIIADIVLKYRTQTLPTGLLFRYAVAEASRVRPTSTRDVHRTKREILKAFESDLSDTPLSSVSDNAGCSVAANAGIAGFAVMYDAVAATLQAVTRRMRDWNDRVAESYALLEARIQSREDALRKLMGTLSQGAHLSPRRSLDGGRGASSAVSSSPHRAAGSFGVSETTGDTSPGALSSARHDANDDSVPQQSPALLTDAELDDVVSRVSSAVASRDRDLRGLCRTVEQRDEQIEAIVQEARPVIAALDSVLASGTEDNAGAAATSMDDGAMAPPQRRSALSLCQEVHALAMRLVTQHRQLQIAAQTATESLHSEVTRHSASATSSSDALETIRSVCDATIASTARADTGEAPPPPSDSNDPTGSRVPKIVASVKLLCRLHEQQEQDLRSLQQQLAKQAASSEGVNRRLENLIFTLHLPSSAATADSDSTERSLEWLDTLGQTIASLQEQVEHMGATIDRLSTDRVQHDAALHCAVHNIDALLAGGVPHATQSASAPGGSASPVPNDELLAEKVAAMSRALVESRSALQSFAAAVEGDQRRWLRMLEAVSGEVPAELDPEADVSLLLSHRIQFALQDILGTREWVRKVLGNVADHVKSMLQVALDHGDEEKEQLLGTFRCRLLCETAVPGVPKPAAEEQNVSSSWRTTEAAVADVLHRLWVHRKQEEIALVTVKGWAQEYQVCCGELFHAAQAGETGKIDDAADADLVTALARRLHKRSPEVAASASSSLDVRVRVEMGCCSLPAELADPFSKAASSTFNVTAEADENFIRDLWAARSTVFLRQREALRLWNEHLCALARQVSSTAEDQKTALHRVIQSLSDQLAEHGTPVRFHRERDSDAAGHPQLLPLFSESEAAHADTSDANVASARHVTEPGTVTPRRKLRHSAKTISTPAETPRSGKRGSRHRTTDEDGEPSDSSTEQLRRLAKALDDTKQQLALAQEKLLIAQGHRGAVTDELRRDEADPTRILRQSIPLLRQCREVLLAGIAQSSQVLEAYPFVAAGSGTSVGANDSYVGDIRTASVDDAPDDGDIQFTVESNDFGVMDTSGTGSSSDEHDTRALVEEFISLRREVLGVVQQRGAARDKTVGLLTSALQALAARYLDVVRGLGGCGALPFDANQIFRSDVAAVPPPDVLASAALRQLFSRVTAAEVEASSRMQQDAERFERHEATERSGKEASIQCLRRLTKLAKRYEAAVKRGIAAAALEDAWESSEGDDVDEDESKPTAANDTPAASAQGDASGQPSIQWVESQRSLSFSSFMSSSSVQFSVEDTLSDLSPDDITKEAQSAVQAATRVAQRLDRLLLTSDAHVSGLAVESLKQCSVLAHKYAKCMDQLLTHASLPLPPRSKLSSSSRALLLTLSSPHASQEAGSPAKDSSARGELVRDLQALNAELLSRVDTLESSVEAGRPHLRQLPTYAAWRAMYESSLNVVESWKAPMLPPQCPAPFPLSATQDGAEVAVASAHADPVQDSSADALRTAAGATSKSSIAIASDPSPDIFAQQRQDPQPPSIPEDLSRIHASFMAHARDVLVDVQKHWKQRLESQNAVLRSVCSRLRSCSGAFGAAVQTAADLRATSSAGADAENTKSPMKHTSSKKGLVSSLSTRSLSRKRSMIAAREENAAQIAEGSRTPGYFSGAAQRSPQLGRRTSAVTITAPGDDGERKDPTPRRSVRGGAALALDAIDGTVLDSTMQAERETLEYLGLLLNAADEHQRQCAQDMAREEATVKALTAENALLSSRVAHLEEECTQHISQYAALSKEIDVTRSQLQALLTIERKEVGVSTDCRVLETLQALYDSAESERRRLERDSLALRRANDELMLMVQVGQGCLGEDDAAGGNDPVQQKTSQIPEQALDEEDHLPPQDESLENGAPHAPWLQRRTESVITQAASTDTPPTLSSTADASAASAAATRQLPAAATDVPTPTPRVTTASSARQGRATPTRVVSPSPRPRTPTPARRPTPQGNKSETRRAVGQSHHGDGMPSDQAVSATAKLALAEIQQLSEHLRTIRKQLLEQRTEYFSLLESESGDTASKEEGASRHASFLVMYCRLRDALVEQLETTSLSLEDATRRVVHEVSTRSANHLRSFQFLSETRHPLVRAAWEVYSVLLLGLRSVHAFAKHTNEGKMSRREALEKLEVVSNQIAAAAEGIAWALANLFTDDELAHVGCSPHLLPPDVRRPTWRDITLSDRFLHLLRVFANDGHEPLLATPPPHPSLHHSLDESSTTNVASSGAGFAGTPRRGVQIASHQSGPVRGMSPSSRPQVLRYTSPIRVPQSR